MEDVDRGPLPVVMLAFEEPSPANNAHGLLPVVGENGVVDGDEGEMDRSKGLAGEAEEDDDNDLGAVKTEELLDGDEGEMDGSKSKGLSGEEEEEHDDDLGAEKTAELVDGDEDHGSKDLPGEEEQRDDRLGAEKTKELLDGDEGEMDGSKGLSGKEAEQKVDDDDLGTEKTAEPVDGDEMDGSKDLPGQEEEEDDGAEKTAELVDGDEDHRSKDLPGEEEEDDDDRLGAEKTEELDDGRAAAWAARQARRVLHVASDLLGVFTASPVFELVAAFVPGLMETAQALAGATALLAASFSAAASHDGRERRAEIRAPARWGRLILHGAAAGAFVLLCFCIHSPIFSLAAVFVPGMMELTCALAAAAALLAFVSRRG